MAVIWGDRYIFTDRALGRMNFLKIERAKVKSVLNNYNRSERSTIPGFSDFKLYTRIYDNYEIGVMAKKGFLGIGKTLIVSVWRRNYKRR